MIAVKLLFAMATVALTALGCAEHAIGATEKDDACTPEAITSLKRRAAAGDVKAMYWLGTDFDVGTCGTVDKQEARKLLGEAARHEFPPAVHVIGVMLRRDGEPRAAIAYFRKSADLGYTLGFVDMGFTYAGKGVAHDAVAAHAWLSLAIAREQQPAPREFLERAREQTAAEMTPADLQRARDVATDLARRYASVKQWTDHD